MREAKNTASSLVRIGYDGQVHKHFRGPNAKERFENEVRVLDYLAKQGCDFVPRLIHSDPETLYMVTSNCGKRVDKIGDMKMQSLFESLRQYGVQHDDVALRNVTYDMHQGRFCLIDFEFATILDPRYPKGPSIR